MSMSTSKDALVKWVLIPLHLIILYRTKLIAPKWAKAIVEYMTNNVMPKKMSEVRKRYLQ